MGFFFFQFICYLSLLLHLSFRLCLCHFISFVRSLPHHPSRLVWPVLLHCSSMLFCLSFSFSIFCCVLFSFIKHFLYNSLHHNLSYSFLIQIFFRFFIFPPKKSSYFSHQTENRNKAKTQIYVKFKTGNSYKPKSANSYSLMGKQIYEQWNKITQIKREMAYKMTVKL